MRKVIAAINTTLDGYCDHTAIDPDDEIHQHYADLLSNAGVLLYGRITYQLMEYWRDVLEHPTGNKATDDFAKKMDDTPKIVFSNSLKQLDWDSARLAEQDLKTVVEALKQQPGKDIYIGSPSLIVALSNLHLIDEYQLCFHPVILGSGLPLFKNINERTVLHYSHSKIVSGGAVILYYTANKETNP